VHRELQLTGSRYQRGTGTDTTERGLTMPDLTTDYATDVVRVLAGHFPGLADATTRDILTRAVVAHQRNPQAPFEVIVDDPRSARWRLKASSRDRTRVRLAYYPVSPPGSAAGNVLEQIVNAALEALEKIPDA
jgi:hypothetical protein